MHSSSSSARSSRTSVVAPRLGGVGALVRRLARRPTAVATTTTAPTTMTPPPNAAAAPPNAVVVGAGPAGVAAAVALAQRGFSVDLFERRPEGEGSDPRRTFGIVLGERALASLESVGVDVRPLRRGRRMLGSVVATARGGLLSEDFFADPYADDDDDEEEEGDLVAQDDQATSDGRLAAPQRSRSRRRRRRPRPAGRLMVVERAAVVSHLLSEAERLCPAPSLRLHWGAPLVGIDFEARVATFGAGENDEQQRQQQQKNTAVPFDLLVGADGASSAVRAALEERGLVSVKRLPSPASSMEYATFHGLDDAGAAEAGGGGSGGGFFVPPAGSAGGTFFYTFLGAAGSPAKGDPPYAGSVALYRRAGSGGWSGIVALPPGKLDALRGKSADAFDAALDPLLPPAAAGKSTGPAARFATFPASWRAEVRRQMAETLAEPGGVGRLTPLAAASAVALPGQRVVLLGDGASSNTPQMGQGAGSAIEDAALLAAALDEAAGKGPPPGVASALLLLPAAGAKDGASPPSPPPPPPPLERALAAYDASRRPQRLALQTMERELAVFRRPPAGSAEPAEDARARKAWAAFFARQKVVSSLARAVAAAASAVAAFFFGRGEGGGGSAAVAARINQMYGWTQLLHSGKGYDRLLASIHRAPAVNFAAAAAAAAAAVAGAVAVVGPRVLAAAVAA